MNRGFSIENIVKSNEDQFIPYHEKENAFSRLVKIHLVSALFISPIYCFLVYKSGFPIIYFLIGIGFSILMPLSMLICYFVKALREKLIYFFITLLFLMQLAAYYDLYNSGFQSLNILLFFAVYAVLVFVMQRLIPVLIFNTMVLVLMAYGLYFSGDIGFSKYGLYGLFLALAFCSLLVLYSRQRMINAVEGQTEYYSRIINNPGNSFILFDPFKREILDYNRAGVMLLCPDNVSVENFREHFFSCYDEHFTSEKTGVQQFKIRENEDLTVEMHVSEIQLKNGEFLLARLENVTNSIQEKENLRIREEKYRNLYHKNQAGVFTIDRKGVLMEFNDTFGTIFEDTLKTGDQLFGKKDEKEWTELIAIIEQKEMLRNYQTHIQLASGKNKWFIFNLYLDSNTQLIEGTVVDITEIQLASAALRQSEQKYRSIYEESNDAIFLLEEDLIIDVNRKAVQLFGINQQELLNKQSLWSLSQDQSQENEKTYKKHFQRLQISRSSKFPWVFKGKFNPIEAEVALIELNIDEKVIYQCVIHDVTERNETIRALDRNRKSFESILENTPEGILIIKDQQILYANREAYQLLNKELIDYSTLFMEEDQKKFETIFLQQLESKEIVQQQLKIQTTESEIIAAVTLATTTFAETEATIVILKDVSLQLKLSKEVLRAEVAEETNKNLEKEIKERITAEKKLQDILLKTQAIFDSSENTFLLTVDLNNRISTFNKHTKNYFHELTGGIMKSGDELTNYFNKVFTSKELRFFAILLEQVKKGKSHQIETKINNQNKDNWMEIFIYPIYDSEGRVYEISMVAHDITVKKKAEQEIIDSLKEKEVLLKEIHHRVKNNLQIISSILNLQSSFVHDEKILDLLQESRNRIRSMAIIHENLYRTTNFSSINFSSYIKNLSISLLASYRINEKNVELDCEMDEVDLELDQAIPCGLIVNELITNSIKYAFPNDRKGKIVIRIEEKDNKIEILVKDDGVGLPENYDIEKSDTLGLQLVLTLVQQLDGVIQLNNLGGTEYLIIFEKTK